MAERLLNHENQEEEKNPYGNPEEHRVKLEKESSNEHDNHASTEKIREISKLAESKAQSSEELNVDVDKNSDNKVNASLHQGIYHGYSGSQAIKRIQKHLKPSERRFSKVIHNSKVETVSDITGGTLARPSGLLYGGIFSLVTSLGFYLIARHYGYEYPYIIGVLFFIGGFVLGLIIELISRTIRKTN